MVLSSGGEHLSETEAWAWSFQEDPRMIDHLLPRGSRDAFLLSLPVTLPFAVKEGAIYFLLTVGACMETGE